MSSLYQAIFLNAMSYSQYHQYYLQTMGIELYVERSQSQEKTSNSESDSITKLDRVTPSITPNKIAQAGISAEIKQKLKAVQMPPESLVALADLTADSLVVDILQVLNVAPETIGLVKRDQFNLNHFIWQFDAKQTLPKFEQGRLTTGPLSLLRHKAQKKALWQCITKMMSQQQDEPY